MLPTCNGRYLVFFCILNANIGLPPCQLLEMLGKNNLCFMALLCGVPQSAEGSIETPPRCFPPESSLLFLEHQPLPPPLSGPTNALLVAKVSPLR